MFDIVRHDMTGDVRRAAVVWARAAIATPRLTATIRARHDALFSQSLTSGGLNTVTNATKGAVSMGMTMGLSVIETMEALTMALDWIEAGVIPCGSRALGRF